MDKRANMSKGAKEKKKKKKEEDELEEEEEEVEPEPEVEEEEEELEPVVPMYSGVTSDEYTWYSMQCIPGREGPTSRQIAALLGKRLPSGQKVKLEVMVPVKYTETINPRTQKVVQSKRLIMPGYVMVKCVMNIEMAQTLYRIGQVRGMGGWESLSVDQKAFPAPLTERQIDEIMAEAGESHVEMEERLAAKPDFPFAEGDFVKVTAGPYKGFAGQVMGIDADKQEVQAVLVIFGKATEVWVGVDRVEQAKPSAVKRMGF